MKKYIKSYLEINESIGRGSVILIKGKAEGGKKRLYAGHVLGTAEFSHGATMLFLADDFYRIMEEDGRLRAVKIGYRNEDSLKAVLNLRSPGKISIVKNNNKTPLHWKTAKHSHIQTALREVESELLTDSYLFESITDANERDRMWKEFSSLVEKRTMNTFFLGKKEIDVIDYSITQNVADRALEGEIDSGAVRYTWEMECLVRLRSRDFDKYLEYFEYDDRVVGVTFVFDSLITVEVDHDPGDYWTPSYTDFSISDVETEISETFVDGTSAGSPELFELLKKCDEVVKTFLDDELEKLVKNNLRTQLLLKRKD